MKRVKSVLFVLLYLFVFIAIETVASMAVLFYKLYTDFDYGNRLIASLDGVDLHNTSTMVDYLKVIYEVVPATLLLSGILMLIPVSIYFIKKKENPYKKINFSKIIFLISFGVLLNVGISSLIDLLPKSLIDNYSQSVNYVNDLPFLPLLFSVGIMGPITEEIFFRYFMMKRFKNKYVAIILPALVFGIAHWNLIQSTYAFLIGMVFAIIYYKTKNLTYTTVIHMAVNSSSVLITVLPLNLSIILGIILGLYFLGYIFITKKKNTLIFA